MPWRYKTVNQIREEFVRRVLSNEKSKDLTDLAGLFKTIQEGYESNPKYKKAVKLFELYRMLDDAGLCGVKQ